MATSEPQPGLLDSTPPAAGDEALTVRGKFLFAGEAKLYMRGVTYGPFAPGPTGEHYRPEAVERDFAAIAAAGLNAVRTYTVPPRWLLDAAWRHGLRVLVGLPWEQHVAFLDEVPPDRIEERIRTGVRACAAHPAVLCYAIGNEIPSAIVRWHGARRIERFLERLYRTAKDEDPGGLVTYVNYPSTEYLQLPFLDFVCFNVYLESRQALERYIARLQNIAGDRPLVMTELGLDSRTYGVDEQARALDRQVRTAFAGGCAGTFVFSWTDEWHRGGYEIEDWDFGVTDRERRPKPALAAVGAAFAGAPFATGADFPFASVIVCTHNGGSTLEECLAAAAGLEYPGYEVIVVSDGSTDSTGEIARGYDVRLIETEQRGLGHARNVGLDAARGQIVAYLDDDAAPDPHWLTYLAHAFATTKHAAVGGPNTPYPGARAIERCVSLVPGGPTHVLLTDTEAEHIPGCNMAFRKECLEEIGGFDPQFWTAGDDVDVCWRLRERGWTLGFDPGAVVMHHRRARVRDFWRQQAGYGKAEALLEHKWPEHYSRGGHVGWSGQMYAYGASPERRRRRWRIYYGLWGSAPFQPLYAPGYQGLRSLLRMPEAYLIILALGALAALAPLWRPLFVALPLFVLAVSALAADATLAAASAPFGAPPTSRGKRLGLRGLTALLFMLQPLARLRGRVADGLTPWRLRQVNGLALPRPRSWELWSERRQPPEERLQALECALRGKGLAVLRGSDYDRWDLEVRAGALAGARIRTAVEEHEGGRQLERVRWWPRWSPEMMLFAGAAATLAAGAAADDAWIPACVFALAAAAVAVGSIRQGAVAIGAVCESLGRQRREVAWARIRAEREAQGGRA